MIQRRQLLAVAASALLVFCGLAAVDTKFAQAKDPQIEGTLAGVNVAARTVAIRRVNNTVVAVVIPATAKIERNGVTVGLAAFKLGIESKPSSMQPARSWSSSKALDHSERFVSARPRLKQIPSLHLKWILCIFMQLARKRLVSWTQFVDGNLDCLAIGANKTDM